MSNKIYQVWGADEEVPGTTSIYYVSQNSDAAKDYVVNLIKKREAKNFKQAVALREQRNKKIELMESQIAALEKVADAGLLKPILDDLEMKLSTEITYRKVCGELNAVEHDAEYYKAHFEHYCNKHHIMIVVFDTDTELRACVDDYINDVTYY